MYYVYLICAVVGGTLIVIQFFLTLMGLGGDDFDGGDGSEVDLDHDGSIETHGHAATNLLFSIITFRTIMAGLAFFGLSGFALMGSTNWDGYTIAAVSVGVGAVAVFIVASIMRSLLKLNADGTIRIGRALGAKGTVYLSIPAAKGGNGKVHVHVAGQMKEYKAITSGEALATGSKIVVVKVVGSDTVEVGPVESVETSPA